ncbi:hypothetical protein LEN26_016946 [Aphanomyces euteiches]|nr:hypothetical protein LEN26_016946 [Aphanomyces euteiches]KAH9108859.1 hypothetical protein AeMF1_016007 [Aphanomyces euteiches]
MEGRMVFLLRALLWTIFLMSSTGYGLDATNSKDLRSRKVYLLPRATNSPPIDVLVDILAKEGMNPLLLDGSEAQSWDEAAKTSDYDLLWSIEPVESSQKVDKLDRRHKVNHLPGRDIFSPVKLVERQRSLESQHGRYHYSFVPPSFSIPDQQSAFLKTFEYMRTVPILSGRIASDPHFRRRWRVTNIDGSTFILTKPSDLTAQSIRVTYIVEPLLISRRKFQLGLYVIIASVDPLRVYIYHNPLLRMCSRAYPTVLSETTPREAFAVTDSAWLPPWEMDDLKAFYTEIPSSQSEGTSNLKVLKRYLEHVGIEADKFQQNLHAAVVKIIAGSRSHFVQAETGRPDGMTSGNYFQFSRFDFEVDDEGKPWLVGVDTAPSFAPKQFGSGSITALLSNVARDAIRLIGVSAPKDSLPADSLVQATTSYCDSNCADKLVRWDTSCWRCPGWYAPPIAARLYTAAMEYTRRGRYHLAFPTVRSELAQFVDRGLSPLDHAFHDYLVSFVYDPKGHAAELDPTVLCVNREQCSHNGDCVNGHCQCDQGYEGKTCYIPSDPDRTVLHEELLSRRSIRTSPAATKEDIEIGEAQSDRFYLTVFGIALLCYVGYKLAVRSLIVSSPDKES